MKIQTASQAPPVQNSKPATAPAKVKEATISSQASAAAESMKAAEKKQASDSVAQQLKKQAQTVNVVA